MTDDTPQISAETIATYKGLYIALTQGHVRLYNALIASSRLTLACVLTFATEREKGSENAREARILPIIEGIGQETLDGFTYVERISHLIYATTLLDTFLLETTTFLFLMFPRAMGKSHQIPIKTLIESASLSSALTQAAHTRARDISFKTFEDRIQFLRDAFGLRVDLERRTQELLDHYTDIRNSAIHDQGIFELALDDSGNVKSKQKTCALHPTQLTDDDPMDAFKAYQKICNAVASAVFEQVLKCNDEDVLGLLRKTMEVANN
jgi:hypothetical protein